MLYPLILILLMATSSIPAQNPTADEADSFHDFTMTTIQGETLSFDRFAGNVVLVVNTASECGYTPQYEGLQKLYETYKNQGLVVLGFPANNFGGQEPGSDQQIAKFCKRNYGVSFPLFSKVSVKGEDQHPLFEFLTSQSNPDFTGPIKWNFEKFLIDRGGSLSGRFRSSVIPMSDELTRRIEALLK